MSPQPNPTFAPGTDKATRQTSLQRKAYVVRVVFSVMILALLAVSDSFCHGRPGQHLWLMLAGALYPHLGHLLLGRYDISSRRGHILFLADGLFVGIVIGALGFAMVPSTVLAVICLFNWMIVGGPVLLALGITFMFAGTLTAEAGYPALLAGTGAACHAADWLASAILLGYFLIVARIIHQLVSALRLQQAEFQTRMDAAGAATSQAERALLSVLPASAARTLETKGALAPEAAQDATLLLVEFVPQAGVAFSLDDLKNFFQVCEMIMTRHGVELVKTFGPRVLALSRKESGPADVLDAFSEIDLFFTDHRHPLAPAGAQHLLRAAMHHGPVTIGLVQPERLNLDLLGKAVDELTELARLAEAQPDTRLIASAAAHAMLRGTVGFTALPTAASQPPCYAYATGQSL